MSDNGFRFWLSDSARNAVIVEIIISSYLWFSGLFEEFAVWHRDVPNACWYLSGIDIPFQGSERGLSVGDSSRQPVSARICLQSIKNVFCFFYLVVKEGEKNQTIVKPLWGKVGRIHMACRVSKHSTRVIPVSPVVARQDVSSETDAFTNVLLTKNTQLRGGEGGEHSNTALIGCTSCSWLISTSAAAKFARPAVCKLDPEILMSDGGAWNRKRGAVPIITSACFLPLVVMEEGDYRGLLAILVIYRFIKKMTPTPPTQRLYKGRAVDESVRHAIKMGGGGSARNHKLFNSKLLLVIIWIPESLDWIHFWPK